MSAKNRVKIRAQISWKILYHKILKIIFHNFENFVFLFLVFTFHTFHTFHTFFPFFPTFIFAHFSFWVDPPIPYTTAEKRSFEGKCEIWRTISQPRTLSADIPASQKGVYLFYNPPINFISRKNHS